MVVDRDPLVRQRIDQRDLGGEGRACQVTAKDNRAGLGNSGDGFRVGTKVHSDRVGWRSRGAWACRRACSSAIARMRAIASSPGSFWPFSHRLMVMAETPDHAAKAGWLAP